MRVRLVLDRQDGTDPVDLARGWLRPDGVVQIVLEGTRLNQLDQVETTVMLALSSQLGVLAKAAEFRPDIVNARPAMTVRPAES